MAVGKDSGWGSSYPTQLETEQDKTTSVLTWKQNHCLSFPSDQWNKDLYFRFPPLIHLSLTLALSVTHTFPEFLAYDPPRVKATGDRTRNIFLWGTQKDQTTKIYNKHLAARHAKEHPLEGILQHLSPHTRLEDVNLGEAARGEEMLSRENSSGMRDEVGLSCRLSRASDMPWGELLHLLAHLFPTVSNKKYLLVGPYSINNPQ